MLFLKIDCLTHMSNSVLIKDFHRCKLVQRHNSTTKPPVVVRKRRIPPDFLHSGITQEALTPADYPSRTNESPVIQKPLA